MLKALPLVRNLFCALLLIICGNTFAQPAITSFSPLSGPVGTTVTITGTNFNATAANNLVYFGAVKATVVSASSTSLTVIAPAGATYQPLSVLDLDTHLTAVAAKPFVITFDIPSGPGITTGFYTSVTTVPTGTLPYYFAFGDLDGDGKSDMVVLNANANTLSVFRNTYALNVPFGSRVDFATGDSPLSVAIGDIDGDGKPDLVVVNERAASVSVYRNTSTPGSLTASSFASPVSFATGEHPYSVALGDLDGDGRTDITVANFQSNTVSVLRNTATAGAVDASSFAVRVDLAAGQNPRFVTVGDLDGDNKPEIVVANQQSATVSVLRNTATAGTLSTSSFATRTDFGTGSNPVGVVLGDLDGDGKTDLAVANNGSNSVSVFRNTSAVGVIDMSSFTPKVDFPTTRQPFALALGDLDGDGKPDIAVANAISNNISVLRNVATPGSLQLTTFDPPGQSSFNGYVTFPAGSYPLSVAIADLDGDSAPELVSSNGENTVYVQKAGIAFHPAITSLSPASGPAGTTVTLTGSNFNANPLANSVYFGGVKAVVTGGSTRSLTVTAPVGTTYQPVTVLNTVTGLTGQAPQPFTTTFINPTGSGIQSNFYLPKADFPTGNLPSSVAFGDVDGDGKPDMVVANQGYSYVSVFRNISANGVINASSFEPGVGFITGSQPVTVALADMDGDSRLDIVTVNSGSPAEVISILRNTATPGSINSSSLATHVDYSNIGVSVSPYSVGIADVDGDGKLDIAVVNIDNPAAVSVFRNGSTPGRITRTTFLSPVRVAAETGSAGYALALGDLDGDGKPDLVLSHGLNTTDSTLSILYNTSSTGSSTPVSFSSPVNLKTGGIARTVVIGDLDGDGRQDLLIAHMGGSSTITIIHNLITPDVRSNPYGAKIEIPVSSNVNGVTINDLDGDGKPDLAVANATTNSLSVLRNISTSGTLNASSFAPKVDFAGGAYPLNLTSGDLDGDGIPEIGVANLNDNTISVFKVAGMPGVPSVFSVSPASGPLGTSVTIKGNNFNPDATADIVYFGSVKATVTAATATTLIVTAPSGANYQPVSVLNSSNGLTAYAASPFDYTFQTIFGASMPPNFYMPGTEFGTGALPYSMAFGDLDGDGKSDVAVVNGNDNTVSVLRNTGTGNMITGSSFAAKVDFATGSEPRGIAIADMDGDGKLDLVVTNSNASSVSVYRNISTAGSITTASFASGVQFTVGDHPYAVATGDLDADGKPELVVANLFSATVSVLKNTGTPGSIDASSFAAKADLVTGSNPRFVALGDLDGDGKRDIAVSNEQAASVSVFRNNFTSGTLDVSSFSLKTDFTTGSNPVAVAINDLDGDGKADLSVANYGSNSVSVLRNTATSGSITTASFAPKTDFATGPGPFALAPGDANGDGKTDLLTVNSGNSTISVLRNTTTGSGITASSFTKADFATGGYPVYIAFGDLDGDGIAELASANAATNSISVLEIFKASANLIPVISSVSPLSASAGSSVTITGNNFDPAVSNNTVYFGAVKAVVTGGSSTSLTATVPAGATYQPVSVLRMPYGLTAYSAASFDLAFTNPFGSGIPANFYKPRVDISLGGRFPFSEALGDVDGDGKPDLVIANTNTYGNGITVYRNTSTTGSIDASSFATGVDFGTVASPSTVLFSDMDGDGRLDIVATNLITGAFSVLRNTSATPGTINASSFAADVTFTLYAHASPYSVAVGDIDGDGKPDIAIANSQANTVSVYRNMATPGIFTASSLAAGVNFVTGTTPRSAVINDIDGDGKPDLVVLNEGSNNVSVFRNTAVSGSITAASFAARADFATGTDPYTVVTGDLDGDGKTDILVNNHGSNSLSVLRNTAVPGSITASSLAPRVDYATGTDPYMAIIADADGDGKPDLLAVNSSANTLSVFRNTSVAGAITTSSFADRVDFATGGYPISLVAGDVDGDGLTDVLTGNAGKSTLSLFQINSASALAGLSAASVSALAAQQETTGKGMVIYPNPTGGEFTLQLSGLKVAAGSMEILNESGKTIDRRSLNISNKAASLTQKLSLRNQPPGVYYVKITTTQGVQITKVVVQR